MLSDICCDVSGCEVPSTLYSRTTDGIVCVVKPVDCRRDVYYWRNPPAVVGAQAFVQRFAKVEAPSYPPCLSLAVPHRTGTELLALNLFRVGSVHSQRVPIGFLDKSRKGLTYNCRTNAEFVLVPPVIPLHT